MINVIMGVKGSGKTKSFLDRVNNAVNKEKGNVVCIARGNRHILYVKHNVRLIDTEHFNINTSEEFYGFICGIISCNFDITHIFIDSMTKIINNSIEEIGSFLNLLNNVSNEFNIDFTITISADVSDANENIKKYLVEI